MGYRHGQLFWGQKFQQDGYFLLQSVKAADDIADMHWVGWGVGIAFTGRHHSG